MTMLSFIRQSITDFRATEPVRRVARWFATTKYARLQAISVLSIFAITTANLSLVSHAVVLADCQNQIVVAHRGMHDAAHTENTLAAFSQAVAAGASSVESDMRLTKDGRWVMMHDARINRTTNKSGYVRNLTLRQIKSARTNDGVLGGVPTLEESLQYLSTVPNVQIMFEIKPISSRISDAKLAALLNTFVTYGVADRTVIETKQTVMLDRIHAMQPAIATQYITSVAVTPQQVVAHNSKYVGIRQTAATPELVQAMKDSGVIVNVWTVATDAEWQNAVMSGANGVITDIPSTVISDCQLAVSLTQQTPPATDPPATDGTPIAPTSETLAPTLTPDSSATTSPTPSVEPAPVETAAPTTQDPVPVPVGTDPQPVQSAN